MKILTAIIVDDDVFIHHQLADMLETNESGIRLLASCENAVQGAEAIRRFNPDVVFLDIQMPGHSGFEMLNSLQERSFNVIFITSHNEYAIQAIRYSAFDYLLKPINATELKNALHRLHEPQSLNEKISSLMHNMSQQPEAFQLVIPTRQGETRIPVNKIIRCEADSNYTHFHLSDKSIFTSSKTLKDFDEVLSDKDFIRIHKSHIVNKRFIENVTADGCLLLKDKTRIEIARRRLTDVRKMFNGNSD